MEQNDQNLLKDTILQLFQSLSNSYVENPYLIGEQLMAIYTNKGINAIPVLFEISTQQNYSINFRKRALLGISICIDKSFALLNDEFIQHIFNAFFNIMSSEPNDKLIQIIVDATVKLLNLIRHQKEVSFDDYGIFHFFESLAESDFCRFLQILAPFLPDNIHFKKNFIEFVIHAFFQSLQIQQKYDILPDIVFIGCFLLQREEIDDENKNNISIQFSQLYIELLNEIDDFKLKVITSFYNAIQFGIPPFKMDIIIYPTLQFLQNPNININFRYHIAYLLSMFMEFDDSKLSNELIVTLFKLSIFLSVMTFDNSLDQLDPDSIEMGVLISECLRRIPNSQVHNVVIPTFLILSGNSEEVNAFDFGSASFFSKLFTALILVDEAIQRSAYLLTNMIPVMADFCVCCFDAEHPAVQNMASSLFSKHASLFIRHILPKIIDIVDLILIKIDSNKFQSGYSLLNSMIYEIPTEICDSLFIKIYTVCTNKINTSLQQQSLDWFFDSWTLLGNLFRNVSDEVGCSYFDDIFLISFGNLNSFYQNQLLRQNQNLPLLDDNYIQLAIVELIGSLSISCSSKLLPHLEDTTKLLLYLLQFHVQGYFQSQITDLYLCQSLLHGLAFFVDNMAEAMAPFMDQILSLAIEYCSSRIDPLINVQYETKEMIYLKKIDFSEHFISPSIDLISDILTSMPEIIQTKEILTAIFSIVIHSLDAITKKELLSSIKLLINLVIFVHDVSQRPNNQGDKNIFEIVKTFIPIIINHINDSDDYDDYEVFSSCIQCIISIYINFGIEIFYSEDENGNQKCKIFDIMEKLLNLAESKHQDENELCFIEELHDKIVKAIIIIIKYYRQPDFSPFIPFIARFLRFFDQNNIYFHIFSINIFSYLVIESNIIDMNLSAHLFEISVKSLKEDSPPYSRYFAFFLSNLRYNYPQLLIDNKDGLIQLIDQNISSIDPLQEGGRALIEHLLALFASIDVCISITNQQKFEWFISFLPIQDSQKENNQIVFIYLITHYPHFPELQSKVMSLFCQVFVSKLTIKNSFLRQGIVKCLFEIIKLSKIIDNPQIIYSLLNGNQIAVNSFYETFTQLDQLLSAQ